MFIIRRTCTKLQEIIKVSGKRKLPDLNKDDSERNIRDISKFFDYLMDTANPHPKIKERALLPKGELNKLTLL